MRRPQAWFRQAELDLEAALATCDRGRFEWACFAAQQAAEKAVKALHEASGVEAWGHSVAGLLEGLDEEPPAGILEAAYALDKLYIPSRYPNAHPSGAPGDRYTEAEAKRAIDDAVRVMDYVRSHLPPA